MVSHPFIVCSILIAARPSSIVSLSVQTGHRVSAPFYPALVFSLGKSLVFLNLLCWYPLLLTTLEAFIPKHNKSTILINSYEQCCVYGCRQADAVNKLN